MVRLWTWLLMAVVAICYGAYQANPMLAVGCGVGIVAIGVLAWAVGRYKENQVKKMVADVDAGADRFIAGADE